MPAKVRGKKSGEGRRRVKFSIELISQARVRMKEVCLLSVNT